MLKSTSLSKLSLFLDPAKPRRLRSRLVAICVEILCILTAIILVDRAVGTALDKTAPSEFKLFLESKKSYDPSVNYDILGIGDSHLADSFVPSILKDYTGLKAFNFGIYHSGPFEWYYIARDIINRSSENLKIIIVGTNPQMFTRRSVATRYTPDFIESPYFRLLALQNQIVRDPLLLFESYRKRYLVRAFWRKLRSGKEPAAMRKVSAIDDGYLKNVWHMSSSGERTKGNSEKITFNTEQVTYLKKLLDYARSQNIQIIFFHPPIFRDNLLQMRETIEYNEYKSIIDDIAIQYGINQFDARETEVGLSLRRQDFLNEAHVCASGAYRVSVALSKWLEGQLTLQGESPRVTEAGRAPPSCVPRPHG